MRSFLKVMLWALGILAAVAIVLNLTVFEPWSVPTDDPNLSASILPTLRPGNRLLVLRNGQVKPGHLVRCSDPDAPGRFVIARVVARGGDSVEVGESVLVNGKRNPSPHACDDKKVAIRHPTTQEDVQLDCVFEDTDGNEHAALRDLAHPEAVRKSVVEVGKVFLVSDDRHLHLDSRDFGQIDPATCNHIVFRLWGDSWFDSSQRMNWLW